MIKNIVGVRCWSELGVILANIWDRAHAKSRDPLEYYVGVRAYRENKEVSVSFLKLHFIVVT